MLLALPDPFQDVAATADGQAVGRKNDYGGSRLFDDRRALDLQLVAKRSTVVDRDD